MTSCPLCLHPFHDPGKCIIQENSYMPMNRCSCDVPVKWSERIEIKRKLAKGEAK